MKLSYFELLSPCPVQIQGIGGIISPRLHDIAALGHHTYQDYLTFLRLDLKKYLTMVGFPEKYGRLSEDEKMQISVFELVVGTKQSSALLQNILNFFIYDDVLYSKEHNGFIVKNAENIIGIITKNNYPTVCDVISQRNNVKSNDTEDPSKIKSKKALEILKKIKNGREKKEKSTHSNQNMELGNIISAVANKSQSLNMMNIWDLTIYQLYDCFARLVYNNIYDIQAMNVAAWGNKDKYFDEASWFKQIMSNN